MSLQNKSGMLSRYFTPIFLGLSLTLIFSLWDEDAFRIKGTEHPLIRKTKGNDRGVTEQTFIKLDDKRFESTPSLVNKPSSSRKGMVLAALSKQAEDRSGDFFLVLLKVFGVIGVGLFGYSLVRTYFSPHATEKTKEKKQSKKAKSDFVINTFQGLIQELKEKEEELERLRRAAEEHALRVESYNDNILQSVPSGVLTVNREKIITTFNNAAATILDLPIESVLNRSYEAVFGKNQKMVLLLGITLQDEIDMLRQECEIRRENGNKIWLGLNTSLLHDRDDQIIGATLVFTDLTEKKMLEEKVALKKRLAMMGEMSAWIAHEFRNYMGTILGFSRLLEKKLGADDARQEMIQSITHELASMEHLITELLSYSKKREIRPVSVSLPSFFHRIMKQFSLNERYAQTRLTATFEDQLPEIELDTTLMRQAISNLIQNGLDAIEEEGMIHTNAYSRPSGRIQIEISDTGTGISEENLDKVLLPFFTTKEKGTGLGLALAHKIILSHNGHIKVESLQGKGTTFTIVLPICQTREIMV